MKWTVILMVIYAQAFITSGLVAQELTPFTFSHTADPEKDQSLTLLTEVNIPSSRFLRLYFDGTQLGNESYLLLEATDGAKQMLRKNDLENWNFSSAYFNGNSVKVSLYKGKGDKNQVSITAIKAGKENKKQTSTSNTATRSHSADETNLNGAVDHDLMPYAAAVGRFTNGNNSFGTGWIAPNGAIVTSKRTASMTDNGYDVLEFNVPLSDSYGNVNHPGPEDQYPINKQRSWQLTQGLITYHYKRKYDFDVEKEEGYGEFHATWAVVEALPNSTGLRPGERQQQYFQIRANASSSEVESMQDARVDILHYGETLLDLVYGTEFRTLKNHVTTLLPSEEYLRFADDRDDVVLYNKDNGDITMSDSDTGAPIVLHGSNVAIGVHNDFYYWPPAGGIGFANNTLLGTLNDFFSTTSTYVDLNAYGQATTGAINKPFHRIWDGIEQVEIGGIVNIANSSYNETLYITKAVTLKAPVGKVIIGEASTSNARMATLLPDAISRSADYTTEADEDDMPVDLDLVPFPTPFTFSTDINYALPESAPVRITVYDHLGNKVKLLTQQAQTRGLHSVTWDGADENGRHVTPGIFVIRIEAGSEAKSVKVIKK